MDTFGIGELVSLVGAGPALDGLVFDTPSRLKVVVAVVDPGRGPVFRTVHPKTLIAREKEGPSDPALRSLVRRTPQPPQRATSAGVTGRKGPAGFSRGAAHRPTGR